MSRIVILGGPFSSTTALYNFLQPQFAIERVIIERRPSRVEIFRKRTKRLGWSKAIGQFCFRVLAAPALEIAARRRIHDIAGLNRLDYSPIPAARISQVASVNSNAAIDLLRELQAVVVIVNGTRIISSEVLRAVPGKLINLHAGITPRYRGVHGAYWALAEGRRDLCGCTVHLVDEGIDTGGVLAQAKIEPTEKDNFASYQTLQLAAGLQLLPSLISAFIAGKPPAANYGCAAESKLWSHPTLCEYLRFRWRQGVK